MYILYNNIPTKKTVFDTVVYSNCVTCLLLSEEDSIISFLYGSIPLFLV